MFRYLFLICLACLPGNFLLAQEVVVQGKVTDSTNEPLSRINVLSHPRNSEDILNFTTTDDSGRYSIKIPDSLELDLSFTGLSYEPMRITIQAGSKGYITRNVTLKNREELLQEVVIEAESNIKVKEDTIVIRASAFREGNEEVLEDLLSKIPGLDIDAEGTIRVGNKAVEKVMVEGDDFFGRGYKILTKNMDHNGIKEVEILQDYSANKLLKDIENSDKVALNLTLKDEYKSEWFGNISGGYDALLQDRYIGRINLMSFGKKNKFYFLSTLNNLGIDSKGSLDDLINSSEYEVHTALGEGIETYNYFDSQEQLHYLGAQRTRFNNSELVSLNSIFNVSEDLKFKLLAFTDWDKIIFHRNSLQQYQLNQVDFTNSEQKKSVRDLNNLFGKLEVDYEIGTSASLKFLSTLSNLNSETEASILFNDEEFSNSVKEEKSSFDQILSYTQKFRDSVVLNISTRYMNERLPQLYGTNRNLMLGGAESNPSRRSTQYVENTLQFFGVEANVFKRFVNQDLIELTAGFSDSKHGLESFLEGPEDQERDYLNDFEYKDRFLFFTPTYTGTYNDLSLSGSLGVRKHFTKLSYETDQKEDNSLVWNPSIRIDWEPVNNHRVLAQYSYSESPVPLPDIHPNYILKNYREVEQGLGTIDLLGQSNLLLNYSAGNWGDRFFANLFATYTHRNDYISTKSDITADIEEVEKSIFKDQELLNMNGSIDQFIDPLSSNIKLKGGVSHSQFDNIVNNNINHIEAWNSQFGFEYKSAFFGSFNFHLGSEWFYSHITSAKDFTSSRNLTFLDLNLNVHPKTSFSFRSEAYFFNDEINTCKPYYFLDFDVRYTIKKNKMSVQLHGENLLNTDRFTNSFVTDISSNQSEYRIIPRYLLLKFNYRF